MKNHSIFCFIFCLLTLFSFTSNPTSPNWHYTDTNNSHLIVFPEEMMIDADINPGDFIGVFYGDSQKRCAGYVRWRVKPNAIDAFADNQYTKRQEGFSFAETIHFKVWKQSSQQELDLEVDFFPTGSYKGLASHEQCFESNGMSFVKNLRIK